MALITPEFLLKLCPTSKKVIRNGVAEFFNKYCNDYEVNTELRIAHFISQAAHESAHFQTLTEYADGKAYEGRKDLGNIKPGDGPLFKGRGIFQLTGRANYKKLGATLKLDLEFHPELASMPENSVRIALEYWRSRALNDLADQDDVIAITKKINGGKNGLEERINYLNKAKSLLKISSNNS